MTPSFEGALARRGHALRNTHPCHQTDATFREIDKLRGVSSQAVFAQSLSSEVSATSARSDRFGLAGIIPSIGGHGWLRACLIRDRFRRDSVVSRDEFVGVQDTGTPAGFVMAARCVRDQTFSRKNASAAARSVVGRAPIRGARPSGRTHRSLWSILSLKAGQSVESMVISQENPPNHRTLPVVVL